MAYNCSEPIKSKSSLNFIALLSMVLSFIAGEMAERLKAAVLKTVEGASPP